MQIIGFSMCIYIYIYISFCVHSPFTLFSYGESERIENGRKKYILKFYIEISWLMQIIGFSMCIYIYIYLFLCAFTVTLFSYGERERKTWFSTIWLEWKGRGNKIGWVEFFTRAHLFFSLSPNWGEKMRENENEFKRQNHPPLCYHFSLNNKGIIVILSLCLYFSILSTKHMMKNTNNFYPPIFYLFTFFFPSNQTAKE